MQRWEYDGDGVVVEDELDDGKGLVLKVVDGDVIDDGCNRDVLMPAEWKASNGDAAPIRCMLMNKKVVVDVHVDDEVVVYSLMISWWSLPVDALDNADAE